MNFYEIRGNAYQLVEDQLVDPINNKLFKSNQVEHVLPTGRKINDIEHWCESRIAKLRVNVASMQEYLQYADGQSYYRDKQQIVDIEREITRTEKYLKENF